MLLRFGLVLLFLLAQRSEANPGVSDVKTAVQIYLNLPFQNQKDREEAAMILTSFLEDAPIDDNKEFLTQIEFGLAANFYKEIHSSLEAKENLYTLLNVMFDHHERAIVSEAKKLPGFAKTIKYSAVFLVGGAGIYALGYPVLAAVVASGSLEAIGVVLFERDKENSKLSLERQNYAKKIVRLQRTYCNSVLSKLGS